MFVLLFRHSLFFNENLKHSGDTIFCNTILYVNLPLRSLRDTKFSNSDEHIKRNCYRQDSTGWEYDYYNLVLCHNI